MLDDKQPPSDDDTNDLIVRNEHGDIQQDIGTRMTERDSYERVRDGFAMAIDGCSHIMLTEPHNADMWRRFRGKLAEFRRAAIQQGRVEDNITRDIAEVRGKPMTWRDARDRIYEGLAQAEGGMRQLAVCHRGDLVFARMARTLEEMTQKLKGQRTAEARSKLRSGLLWMPGDD